MSDSYHLAELSIAQSADDSRRVMPVILPRHRRILDVGCGAGQTLIASQLAPAVQAVGLDVDQDALSLGRSWTSHVGFVAGAAEHLPFPDYSFDLVLSRVTLPLTYWPAAVAEIGRVAAPGGEVWLVLHSLRKTVRDLVESARGRRWKRTLYRSYVLVNGALLHTTGQLLPGPAGGYETFQTPEVVRRTLGAAGFANIVVQQGRHFVVTATKPRFSSAR